MSAITMQTNKSQCDDLLVVLPHAILTVEVEGVDSSRGAEQVVKFGLQSRLRV